MYRLDRAWQEKIVPLDEFREARVFINMKAAVKIILQDESPPRHAELYNRLRYAVRADMHCAIQETASEIIDELQLQTLRLDSALSALEALQRELDANAKRERAYAEELMARGGLQVREREWYMHQLDGASVANQYCADQLYMILSRMDCRAP
jgi:hypothetical protein